MTCSPIPAFICEEKSLSFNKKCIRMKVNYIFFLECYTPLIFKASLLFLGLFRGSLSITGDVKVPQVRLLTCCIVTEKSVTYDTLTMGNHHSWAA